MRPKPSAQKSPGERVVQDIRRATHKHYSAEDKIRIVLDGLRGEDSITQENCRLGGIPFLIIPHGALGAMLPGLFELNPS